MKNKWSLVLAGIICLPLMMFGQFKHIPDGNTVRPVELEPIQDIRDGLPKVLEETSPFIPATLGYFQVVPKGLQVISRDINNFPSFIKGMPIGLSPNIDAEILGRTYVQYFDKMFAIQTPNEELAIVKIDLDEIGMEHIRISQNYKGLPVYGAEFVVHCKEGRIISSNGRLYPSPTLPTLEVKNLLEESELISIVESYEGKSIRTLKEADIKMFGIDQFKSELVIYHKNNEANQAALVYHVKVYFDLLHPHDYFIDAVSGTMINSFEAICKLHNPFDHEDGAKILPPDGPAVATAKDLFNINRTINTYEAGSSFYMLDASRAMFNNTLSDMPDEPVGVIWTIDAFNTSPQNNNFNYDHITSSNNSWDHKTAVSAHYNAGKAYEYFEDTHNRESINGNGGNVISIVNVSEANGSGMDNAFWNGAAMFYGNGNVAFEPLAKALDVAGHELSHGVVQSTANLEYQGESGAMNESFADIFGAMIDRNDWKMGEDIVKLSSFPSGALRDMENPHNGGNSLGDPGWQPDHMNEKYTGSQDNGGVHINSGITNHAYYLFAEEVSKETAEKVFYRALTKYLTKSSKFIDLRNAVLQSSTDLFNNTVVNEAAAAFDAVGIFGGSGGDYENDVNENPGEELILFTNSDFDGLKIVNDQLSLIADPLSNSSVISKPSVTDDGSEVVFIGTDLKMHYIFIDWDNSTVDESIIQNQAIWRNVVISKDGNRVAAITDDLDNIVSVFDFNLGEWNDYELYNPTFSEGVSTGDVDFADAMEFDFSGEWVMYDAQSTINSNTSQDIEYWDIGFINVFDENSNNWAGGDIQKLFTQLPENTNIGNPAFSKNSPYILAFDYIDPNSNWIYGANIETGDVGEIFQNSGLGYPSYSNDDSKLIFDNKWLFGIDIAVVDLASNKITAADNPSVFIENARWGVWFSNGERDLAEVLELEHGLGTFSVYPNPVKNQLIFETDVQISGNVRLNIYNNLGLKMIQSELQILKGADINQLDVSDLIPGQYILSLDFGSQQLNTIFIKL